MQTFTVLLLVFVILFLSWIAGLGSASAQKVFYEQRDTHNVLVAVDGNSFVFETVQGHTLTGALSVVSETGSSSLDLVPKVLGPLATPPMCKYRSC